MSLTGNDEDEQYERNRRRRLREIVDDLQADFEYIDDPEGGND